MLLYNTCCASCAASMANLHAVGLLPACPQVVRVQLPSCGAVRYSLHSVHNPFKVVHHRLLNLSAVFPTGGVCAASFRHRLPQVLHRCNQEGQLCPVHQPQARRLSALAFYCVLRLGILTPSNHVRCTCGSSTTGKPAHCTCICLCVAPSGHVQTRDYMQNQMVYNVIDTDYTEWCMMCSECSVVVLSCSFVSCNLLAALSQRHTCISHVLAAALLPSSTLAAVCTCLLLFAQL
jgi:hypothetical protein